MKTSKQRDIFLKYLRDIYKDNQTLEISTDTIYSELCSFNINREKYQKIIKTNIVPVQIALGRKFEKYSWNNDYYWIFENRCGESDIKYYNKIKEGTKIYISFDTNQIYLLLENIFDYLIQENIVSEGKITKELRNDTISLVIANKRDFLRVIDYINSLEYLSNDKKILFRPNIYANPFLLNDKYVGIIKDGGISYNYLLSKILKEYFIFNRKNNTLDNIDSHNFKLYLENTYLNNLKYKNNNEIRIMINILIQVLEDKLTIKDFTDIYYNNVKESEISTRDEKLAINIISKLESKYNLDMAHKILLEYFRTNNINIFTRDNGIRRLVLDNFTSDKLKKIITDKGYNAFLKVSFETLEKYGKEQLEYAIKILIGDIKGDNKLEGFTNDNDSRSRLGFIIPIDLLLEEIKLQVTKQGLEYNLENIIKLIKAKEMAFDKDM